MPLVVLLELLKELLPLQALLLCNALKHLLDAYKTKQLFTLPPTFQTESSHKIVRTTQYVHACHLQSSTLYCYML